MREGMVAIHLVQKIDKEGLFVTLELPRKWINGAWLFVAMEIFDGE